MKDYGKSERMVEIEGQIREACKKRALLDEAITRLREYSPTYEAGATACKDKISGLVGKGNEISNSIGGLKTELELAEIDHLANLELEVQLEVRTLETDEEREIRESSEVGEPEPESAN
jgi:hypothetical protein